MLDKANNIMKTRIKLKVCGMRDKQNIIDVCRLKPDYLGFIFYEKSKRFVDENFSSDNMVSVSFFFASCLSCELK